ILTLPIVLLIYRSRPPDGVVAWSWFALYGITRSIAEIWREPDIVVGGITGGQMLALPMIVIGIIMVTIAYRKSLRAARSA
ncbi:MAG: prolipoprotein diacylglyceryl transferase, partial [Candidatus Eremiobacteraeota bacterium]|nr:prolipoprotein diacylglyceryl transferase [Candidatus Eremiobacteraeota bacterium]